MSAHSASLGFGIGIETLQIAPAKAPSRTQSKQENLRMLGTFATP